MQILFAFLKYILVHDHLCLPKFIIKPFFIKGIIHLPAKYAPRTNPQMSLGFQVCNVEYLHYNPQPTEHK